MANRFQRLFSLEANQYTKDCPIIIEAGALQKDIETGNVIAQIKMRNIGDAPIASCKISLKAFENNGDEVEGVSSFSYLDLNAGRGCEFGTKVPVILPDKTTRSFSVDIIEIVFTDGTVKKLDNNKWTAIPDQQPIEAILTDTALAQQYKIEAGKGANLFPEKKDGFFLCTCGAVNYDTAETCYKCGNSYYNLCGYMDRDYLLRKIDERNEKRRIEQDKKEEKKKLYIKIGAAAIAALIVFGIINSIHQKNEEKKEAEIRASLAGKNYTAVVSDWGERYCDFNNDGTVHSYSIDNSGEDWGDSEYVYGVRKLSDGRYGLDFAMSEKSLFYNDEYDYVVTGIEGNQITEFTDTDDYAGYDVYKLDSNRTDRQTADKTENDSEDNEKQAEIENISDAQVGSYVIFGTYEQDNDSSNGKEDIEWLVLAKEDNKVLVISKYALDCLPYHNSETSITWEKCDLRRWLNESFFNEAFSSEEQSLIPIITVKADRNPDHNTDPGNDTEDQVFLLSITEVNQYFSNKSDRPCKGTKYCILKGAEDPDDNGGVDWWLRSPGSSSDHASGVSHSGLIWDIGVSVNDATNGIRPALWINLEE